MASSIHIDPPLEIGVHVLNDYDEDQLKSLKIVKEDDDMIKMSWLQDISEKKLLEQDKEPQTILTKKKLLIGRLYSPYWLQVWLTPTAGINLNSTGCLIFKINVSVSTEEHLTEDKKKRAESSSTSTKTNSNELVGGPVCEIFYNVNVVKEKIPLKNTGGIWKPERQYSLNSSSNPYNGVLTFHLWFKLMDESASIHAEKNALKHLSALYVDQNLCDIYFCLQNRKRIGAHRCILSARSPVFDAMFKHEMKEAMTGEVDIKDIEPEVFKELLHFIYASNLSKPLTEENAKLLFVAAEKYDIEDLKNICLRFLLQCLRLYNVVHLMVWADHNSIEKLKKATLEFVAINAEPICLSEQWKDFTRTNPDLTVLATREMVKKMSADIKKSQNKS